MTIFQRFSSGFAVAVGAAALCFASADVSAQSSSLYHREAQRNAAAAANQVPRRDGNQPTLAPAVRAMSLFAIARPEPRTFKKHDLVTIVISESTSADISSSLETNKETSISGEISAFPALRLADLLQLQLRPSNFDRGTPAVGIDFEKEFEGEGDYSRTDQFTARITAQIIDIKPNGTLVLEARKFIRNEDETMRITLTGTCRTDDISADNTVQSTKLFDLHLTKDHDGEIRKATKKGLFTKVFETLFAF